MGTINGTSDEHGYTTRVEYSISQNTTSRTATITAKLFWKLTMSSSHFYNLIYHDAYYQLIIDSSTVLSDFFTFNWRERGVSDWQLGETKVKTIAYDTSGNAGPIDISAKIWTGINKSSTSYELGSNGYYYVSGSVSIPSIASKTTTDTTKNSKPTTTSTTSSGTTTTVVKPQYNFKNSYNAALRLFSSTATEFVTNGIGVLTDVLSCEVTEERNGEFELEMEYPITGRWYDQIDHRSLIVSKSNPYSDAQAFRVYKISKPINGIVTINAQHISYDLSGFTVSPYSATGIVSAFDKIYENIPSSERSAFYFSFETTKTSTSSFKITEPMTVRSLLGGVEGSILDTFLGEYEFNNYTVKLHPARGSDNGVYIRYGKNLTDITAETDSSGVYTAVHPYYYSEQDDGSGNTTTTFVELDDKIIQTDSTLFSSYKKVLALDLTSSFDEAPTKAELKTKAEEYIENNKLTSVKDSIDISFLNLSQCDEYESMDLTLLETIKLCDTVHIEYPELGVSQSLKCIKTVYDPITDNYISLELGESSASLSTTVSTSLSTQSQQATEISNLKANSVTTDYLKAVRADIDELYATKAEVEELSAEAITTNNLAAKTAELGYLTSTEIDAKYASIDSLDSALADIDQLDAKVAVIDEAYVTSEKVDTLIADYIKSDSFESDIAYLNYVKANQLEAGDINVDNLSATLANIYKLVSNNGDFTDLEAIHLSADNTVIDSAFIGTEAVTSLSAEKIASGTIDTNKVSIISESGNLSIVDNMIQIKDDNDVVRVQIGKDASGNYSYYLWDSDGNLMWDPEGLYATGMHDGIIRDAQVADDANISGDKINIASVVSKINENGDIQVDAGNVNINGKTLQTAYSSIITRINSVDETTVKSIIVEYAQSSSSEIAPTSGWTSDASSITWEDGKFMWQRTATYTGTSTTPTYTEAVCLSGSTGATGATGAQGEKGEKGDTGATGNGVSAITNYYLATSSSSGVTTSTSGWTTTVQSITSTNKYLWNYEKITYTDNTSTTTTPCIIGTYGATGATGATGNGVSSITEYYAVSSSNSTAPSSWSTTVPTMTSTNRYLWNYETITYTDKTTANTAKRVIGVYGDTGAQGEQGEKGDDGVSISSCVVTYQVGTSGTTAPTGTWSSSPVATTAAGQYLWTKTVITFEDGSSTTSYSVAAHGATGAQGEKGDAGDGGNLVINGYGDHLDNTNFTGATFVRSDEVDGCYGYFKGIGLTDHIEIEQNATYILKAWIRKDPDNTGTKGNYFGLAPYDVDGNFIAHNNLSQYNSNLFYLAADLKPGDTVVYFTDLTNWIITTTQGYQRAFLFYGYTDSTGYTYPDGTYSRYLYTKNTGMYAGNDSVDQDANTITLKTAWTGPTFTAGTCVSQVTAGSTYQYFLQAGKSAKDDWTLYQKVFTPKDYIRLKYAKTIKIRPMYDRSYASIHYAGIYLGKQTIQSSTLYYASSSGVSYPAKPTAEVTTSSASTYAAWNLTLPTYSSSYPYLYICTQNSMNDGTFSWTSVEPSSYSNWTAAIQEDLSSYKTTTTEKFSNFQTDIDGLTSVVGEETDGTFNDSGTGTVIGSTTTLYGLINTLKQTASSLQVQISSSEESITEINTTLNGDDDDTGLASQVSTLLERTSTLEVDTNNIRLAVSGDSSTVSQDLITEDQSLYDRVTELSSLIVSSDGINARIESLEDTLDGSVLKYMSYNATEDGLEIKGSDESTYTLQSNTAYEFRKPTSSDGDYDTLLRVSSKGTEVTTTDTGQVAFSADPLDDDDSNREWVIRLGGANSNSKHNLNIVWIGGTT